MGTLLAECLLLQDAPEYGKPSGVGITVAPSGHKKLWLLSRILIGRVLQIHVAGEACESWAHLCLEKVSHSAGSPASGRTWAFATTLPRMW